MSHEVWEEYYDRLAALIRDAPDDAGLREHAADGRAPGAASERAARRGRGHRASRQPVEGEAARRRDAAEDRQRCRRSSRRRRSSSASTSATSISSARSDRRTASPRCCSASADRATRSPGVPKGRLFPTSRDDLVECAALLRAVRRGELDRDRVARRAARRAGAADRRGVGVPRVRARTSCSRWCAARGRIATCARGLRRGAGDAGRRASATRRGRRAALVHRDEVQRRRARPPRRRGCSR